MSDLLKNARASLGLGKMKSIKPQKLTNQELANEYLKLKNPGLVSEVGAKSGNIFQNAYNELTTGLQGLIALPGIALSIGKKAVTGDLEGAANDVKTIATGTLKGLADYYGDWLKNPIEHIIENPINSALDIQAVVDPGLKLAGMAADAAREAATTADRVALTEVAREAGKSALGVKSSFTKLQNVLNTAYGVGSSLPGAKSAKLSSPMTLGQRVTDLGKQAMQASTQAAGVPALAVAAPDLTKSVLGLKQLGKMPKGVFDLTREKIIEAEKFLADNPNKLGPEELASAQSKLDKLKNQINQTEKLNDQAKLNSIRQQQEMLKNPMDRGVRRQMNEANPALKGKPIMIEPTKPFGEKFINDIVANAKKTARKIRSEAVPAEIAKPVEAIKKIKNLRKAVNPHQIITGIIKVAANPNKLAKAAPWLKKMAPGITAKIGQTAGKMLETMNASKESMAIENQMNDLDMRLKKTDPIIETLPEETRKQMLLGLPLGETTLPGNLSKSQLWAIQERYNVLHDLQSMANDKRIGKAARITRQTQPAFQKLMMDKYGARTAIPESVEGVTNPESWIRPGDRYVLQQSTPILGAYPMTKEEKVAQIPRGLWDVVKKIPAENPNAGPDILMKEAATGKEMVIPANKFQDYLLRSEGKANIQKYLDLQKNYQAMLPVDGVTSNTANKITSSRLAASVPQLIKGAKNTIKTDIVKGREGLTSSLQNAFKQRTDFLANPEAIVGPMTDQIINGITPFARGPLQGSDIGKIMKSVKTGSLGSGILDLMPKPMIEDRASAIIQQDLKNIITKSPTSVDWYNWLQEQPHGFEQAMADFPLTDKLLKTKKGFNLSTWNKEEIQSLQGWLENHPEVPIPDSFKKFKKIEPTFGNISNPTWQPQEAFNTTLQGYSTKDLLDSLKTKSGPAWKEALQIAAQGSGEKIKEMSQTLGQIKSIIGKDNFSKLIQAANAGYDLPKIRTIVQDILTQRVGKIYDKKLAGLMKNASDNPHLVRTFNSVSEITPEVKISLAKSITAGVQADTDKLAKSIQQMEEQQPWLNGLMDLANKPRTISTNAGDIITKGVPIEHISPKEIASKATKFSTGESFQAGLQDANKVNLDLVESGRKTFNYLSGIETSARAFDAMRKMNGVRYATDQELQYKTAARGNEASGAEKTIGGALDPGMVAVVNPQTQFRIFKKFEKPLQHAYLYYDQLIKNGISPDKAMEMTQALGDIKDQFLTTSMGLMGTKDVLIVPRGVYNEFQTQLKPASTASTLAGQLWDGMNNVFRTGFLALNPSWALMNNPVGNFIMGLLGGARLKNIAEESMAAIKGIKSGKQVVGKIVGQIPEENIAAHGLTSEMMGVDVPLADKIKQSGFVVNPSDSNFVKAAKNVGNAAGRYVAAPVGKFIDFMYGLNQGVDEITRRAAVSGNVEQMALARARRELGPSEIANLKQLGQNIQDTSVYMKQLGKIVRSPKLTKMAVDKMEEFVYNFNNMNRFEKQYIRRFGFMFYSWTKHATKMLYLLNAKYPAAGNVLAKMAKIGNEISDEKWQQEGVNPEVLPNYLQGTIPMGKNKQTGTETYLNMSNMNPLQLIGGLLPAENPLWKIFIERKMGAKEFPAGQRFTSPNVVEVQGKFWKWDSGLGKAVPATPQDTLPSLPEHVLSQFPTYKWLQILKEPSLQYDTASLLNPAVRVLAKGDVPEKNVVKDVILRAFGINLSDADVKVMTDNYYKQQTLATKTLMQRAINEGVKRQ